MNLLLINISQASISLSKLRSDYSLQIFRYCKLKDVINLVLFSIAATEAIRCFQCSSDTDPKGEDLCGAYATFDKERNVPIECSSEESHMPGTFCVKYTEQSPRGFICKYVC